MKTIQSLRRLTAILVALAMPCVGDDAPTTNPEVLSDGNSSLQKRVENMHQTRYIEIFLAAKDQPTGELVAACYNTMFLPGGIPASKDTSPQALVEGLDFEKIKAEFGVLNASLNGPKIWLPDWTEIDTGVVREFNGIKAAWVAQLNMGDNTGGVSESTPYQPVQIKRKSSLGWNKGTTVLLLDDAEGNTWIMKGFQQGLEPEYTYDEFLSQGADAYQNLPDGWKVRVVTLENDLIETPEGGVASIMPDEFFNVYDRTGPGMSNYQP